MPSIAVSPLAHSQLINQSHFFGSLAPETSQKVHDFTASFQANIGLQIE